MEMNQSPALSCHFVIQVNRGVLLSTAIQTLKARNVKRPKLAHLTVLDIQTLSGHRDHRAATSVTQHIVKKNKVKTNPK